MLSRTYSCWKNDNYFKTPEFLLMMFNPCEAFITFKWFCEMRVKLHYNHIVQNWKMPEKVSTWIVNEHFNIQIESSIQESLELFLCWDPRQPLGCLAKLRIEMPKLCPIRYKICVYFMAAAWSLNLKRPRSIYCAFYISTAIYHFTIGKSPWLCT